MNAKLGYVLSFLLGTAAGGTTAFILTKKKYERSVDDEITEIRNRYAELQKELIAKNEKEKEKIMKFEEELENVAQEAIDNYKVLEEIAMDEGYTEPNITVVTAEDMNNMTEEEVEEIVESEPQEPVAVLNDDIVDEDPYVISPEEFGNLDHSLLSFTYYAGDKVICDENDQPLDNPDDIFGTYALGTFGMYDDYTVYVRNDKLKCDYEILLDERSYANCHS